MRKLYQPESSVLTGSYAPVETTELLENPPRFTWMPANIEGGTYCLEVSTSPEFDRNSTRSFSPAYNNFLHLHRYLNQVLIIYADLKF